MTPYRPLRAVWTLQRPYRATTLSPGCASPDAPAQDRPYRPSHARPPGVPATTPARPAGPPARPCVAPPGAGGHAHGPGRGSSPQPASPCPTTAPQGKSPETPCTHTRLCLIYYMSHTYSSHASSQPIQLTDQLTWTLYPPNAWHPTHLPPTVVSTPHTYATPVKATVYSTPHDPTKPHTADFML